MGPNYLVYIYNSTTNYNEVRQRVLSITLFAFCCFFLQMTELQLEILFGGMGYEVINVRIVEDIHTGANKG